MTGWCLVLIWYERKILLASWLTRQPNIVILAAKSREAAVPAPKNRFFYLSLDSFRSSDLLNKKKYY